MPSPRTKPSRTSLFVFVMLLIALPFGYVFSYAPVVRFAGGHECTRASMRPGSPIVSWTPGPEYPACKHVGWVIDNTPLRRPLLLWADLWGVRDHFDVEEINRMIE